MSTNDLLDRLEVLGDHIEHERAARQVRSVTSNPPFFAPSTMGHRRLVGAFATILVVGAIAGLVAVTLREDPGVEQPGSQDTAAAQTTTSSIPVTTGSEVDQLLFPSIDSAGLHIDQASASPSPTGRVAGTLMAPSGDLFGIGLIENFWGALPNDWDQRDIGARRFGVGDEMGATVYATVDPCDLVSVKDQRANTTPWAADVTAMLESLAIEDGQVTVGVPAGWTNIGVGSVTTLYDLTYTVDLDGVSRTVSLMQMPNTTVGALLAQSQWNPATPTDLGDADHVRAWFIAPPVATTTFLAWTDQSGSAVVLGADHATIAELQQLAAMLQFGQANRWANSLNAPSDGSAVTVVSVASPDGAACPQRALELRP